MLAALAIAPVLGATLWPLAAGPRESPWCLWCGAHPGAELVLNTLLLVPLGAALAYRGRRAGLLAGGAIVAAIELAQAFVPGRSPNIADGAANLAGLALGLLVAARWPRWRRPAPAEGRRLAAAAAAGFAAVLAVTGVLWLPAWPATRWFGQWAPRLGHLDAWQGAVQSAHVGVEATPAWLLENTEAVRAALAAGGPVEVEATAAEAPRRLAPIFAIADDVPQEIALLGAEGSDLVFRFRTRAAAAGFGHPDLRWHGVLAAVPPGAPLRLGLWREGRTWCLAAAGARRCGLGHTLAQGWMLLAGPSALPESARMSLGLAWIAALVFPLAFWARGRAALPAAAVALTGLLAVPAVLGIAPSGGVEMAGMALGWAAGTALRRPAVRH